MWCTVMIIIIIIIKRRSTAGKTTWFESKYFRSILIRLYKEYSMTGKLNNYINKQCVVGVNE